MPGPAMGSPCRRLSSRPDWQTCPVAEYLRREIKRTAANLPVGLVKLQTVVSVLLAVDFVRQAAQDERDQRTFFLWLHVLVAIALLISSLFFAAVWRKRRNGQKPVSER